MNSDLAVETRQAARASDFPKLVVVIPALNEAKSIGGVLDEISESLSGIAYSVVVVDGNSTDGTSEIARQKGAIVVDQRGVGYGDALLTGFLFARNNLDAGLIAMMDADMSYDPKDIPVLMEQIIDGKADLVVGNRFKGMEEGAMPFVNRIGNRVLSWIARRCLRLKVSDTQCGLRVFRADLVDQLELTKEGMPFAIEMLVEAKFCGAKICEAPVSYRPRIGTPKLSPLKDGLRIFGTILRLMRDTQPLLFFGGIGLILGATGVFLGLDVMLEWFRTRSVGRIPSVILSALLIIGSMQFFTLGLVADMIKGLRRNRNRFENFCR